MAADSNHNLPSHPPNPPPSNGINWLVFFQWLETRYGRITIFGSIILFGYGAGFFSSKFIKDREILILERDYNNLQYEMNAQKIQFERERSDSRLDLNQTKIRLFNLRDSIRNEKPKQ